MKIGINGKSAGTGKGTTKLMAILAIVYGIILIIWPDLNARLLGYVIAGAFVAIGLAFIVKYIRKNVYDDFYKKELVWGLTALFIGILFFIKVEILIGILPMILGIMILISGIVKLQNAFDLVRINVGNWKPVMVMAVLNVALGLILLVNPVWVAEIIFILIGVGLVYSGITDLITIVLFEKNSKEFYAQEEEIYQEQKEK